MRESKTIIDWEKLKKYHSIYGLLIILSSTNIELVKLYPWKDRKYDGFPRFYLAVTVMGVALLEDVPQLVCQIMLLASDKVSTVAIVSLSLTIASLLWRIAKRFLLLVATEALDNLPDGEKTVRM